ncbi:Helicase associated domain protein [Kitasatospora sp. NA04385]|nr:Helicase associated domain protein [Kitasatospora sp. NA04385]
MVEALAVPQKSGKRTTGRSAEAQMAPGEGEGGGSAAGGFSLPVRFQSKVDEDVLALFIQARVLTGENQLWREGLGHARRWHAGHGNLDVPYSARVGENGVFRLGEWLTQRRVEFANGELARHRVKMLDDLDMIWSVSDARFDTGLDWARLWAKEHGGSLAAPARASIGGYAIGGWLAGLRAAAEVPEGEPGALAPSARPRSRRSTLVVPALAGHLAALVRDRPAVVAGVGRPSRLGAAAGGDGVRGRAAGPVGVGAAGGLRRARPGAAGPGAGDRHRGGPGAGRRPRGGRGEAEGVAHRPVRRRAGGLGGLCRAGGARPRAAPA